MDPELRWFPADESLRAEGYEKLLPPLVAELRRAVRVWRNQNYAGVSETSRSLLRWWFQTPHTGFQYYFAQREALETLVFLYEARGARHSTDLLKYDKTGAFSRGGGRQNEEWLRLVFKLATGSGKTKVLSLAMTWSYFHKRYEPGSGLSQNFLLVAPNLIVLERLMADFEGLAIFYSDPLLPANGFEGRHWQDDFQLTLHVQDGLGFVSRTGNLFLTNVHRINDKTPTPSYDDDDRSDYFLGVRPNPKAATADLGRVLRQLDELMVLNDEAHHIHNKDLAWAQDIADLHRALKQRGGTGLSLQIDVTATPRHNDGAIFAQTVCDYPLVEAIAQNVVKRPVIPDEASLAKIGEKESLQFVEKYSDFLHLGYLEWEKAYGEHLKMGKKAILFVMTDDTKNCDAVAEWLESNYPALKGAVLTIHTNKSGEIAKGDLEGLRKLANEIDKNESPYKAIVSVLMLKEGWDVKNVTTIVGLRAYSAKSNILPEQTLGRGLRRMYRGENVTEYVSVVGTRAFIDFIESIKKEGVELERTAMGAGTPPKAPTVVEIPREKAARSELDIVFPMLKPRYYRNFKNLEFLDLSSLQFTPVPYREFSAGEQRQIVFREVATDEITHTTEMDAVYTQDYQTALGFFARNLMRELRLVSGADALYGKLKEFVRDRLFERPVVLDDLNTLRNLSEPAAKKTLYDAFKTGINALTVEDKGRAESEDKFRASALRPFVTGKSEGYVPQKSLQSLIVSDDSDLEIEFAKFLDRCPDVQAFVKNYVHNNGFSVDYVRTDGNISRYYPDFIVKSVAGVVVFAETKGREDVDTAPKMERLKAWCADAGAGFDFVFVDEAGFRMFPPATLADLLAVFRRFKPSAPPLN